MLNFFRNIRRNFFYQNNNYLSINDEPLTSIQIDCPPEHKPKKNYLKTISKDVLQNEIFVFLKVQDLIHLIGDRQLRATIDNFLETHGYAVSKRIGNDRLLYRQKKSQKRNQLWGVLLLLASSTGLNALFTYRIFVNNAEAILPLKAQYQAPTNGSDFTPPDPNNTQSCQQRLDYLIYDDIVFSYDAEKCLFDLYSNRCYPGCAYHDYLSWDQSDFNRSPITPGGALCHDIFENLQSQKCYPARTIPPYLGAASLITFVFLCIGYIIKKESLHPQTLNDLSTIDPQILEFFSHATGDTIERLKDLKIETALTNFYVNNNGLFYRPIRITDTSVIANKERIHI